MSNTRKPIVQIGQINISDIYEQKIIPNRKQDEVIFSVSYLKLVSSIESVKSGLLSPIVVRQDKEGKYELFCGYRRYLAYRGLLQSGDGKYKTILAMVWPPETSNKEMAKQTIHENKVRSNLKSIEAIEQEIATITVYFNCEVSDVEANKKKGYKILRLYLSYIRNLKKNVYFDAIINETGYDNPQNVLRDFFDAIGESERSFFDKAREIMEATPEVLTLLREKRISLRHAKALRNLKSGEDRDKIIEKVQKGNISYKEMDALVRESKRRYSPAKNRNEVSKQLENISSLITDINEDISEEKYQMLKGYLELIENILKIKSI